MNCPANSSKASHLAVRLMVIALLALATSARAPAHEFRYTANLTGGAEAPPNASPGTGHVVVTLDLDLITMRVETEFSDLLGTVTAAHIHAPTVAAGTGTADVATQVPSFDGFPTGVSSSDYDHTFDLALASSYNPAFITSSGGTISQALNALIFALNDGKAYINLHTTAFAGGEIRGFLSYLPGDFNDDGVVDGADYVVWRKMNGDSGDGLAADANNDFVVNDLDYDEWRENYGRTGLSGAGSGAAIVAQVPEPGMLAFLLPLLIARLTRRRER